MERYSNLKIRLYQDLCDDVVSREEYGEMNTRFAQKIKEAQDKIQEIRMAKEAGLTVCSGGIIGMGETWEDRSDMAVSLSELEIESIPINALIPGKGTALQDVPPLSEDDIIRTVALFRYINPTAYVRMAAGRNYFKDGGKRLFHACVNATITGNNIKELYITLRSTYEH